MQSKGCLLLFILAAVAGAGRAQTSINLKTQARDVDLTGAQYTKPFKSGTVLPAICSTGEFFFKSDAIPGRNLYACTGTNTWTTQSSSDGASVFAGLTDVDLVSPNTGDVPVYDASEAKWKNKGIVGGASGAIAVDANLTPVEIELNAAAAKIYLSATTPEADSIPRADATGKIAAGWLPAVVPSAHTSTHAHGGSDEIAVAIPAANAIPKADNTGKLAAAWLPVTAPAAHATSHRAGGTDEIAVAIPAANAIPKADNTGKLAAAWLPVTAPAAHATSHQTGGTDEIAVAIPAANAIPKADNTGKLAAAWLPTSKVTQTLSLPTGHYNGTVPAWGDAWSAPATNPAVLDQSTIGQALGGQMRRAALGFATTTNQYAMTFFRIPTGWDGSAINAKYGFYVSTGSVAGEVVSFKADSFCFSTGLLSSPTYNLGAASNTTLVSGRTAGANYYVGDSLLSIPITGCSAGDYINIRLYRDTAVANDAAGTINLLDFSVDIIVNLQ